MACRTAAHPFGLGQTFWLAQALHTIRSLATPLALRLDVSPPPMERLMVVDTAAREWFAVSVGPILNELFAEQLAIIRTEIAKIKENPCKYSKLHKLYGVENFEQMSEAKVAADTLLPLVKGYANVFRVDDDINKDGIALAPSLVNMKRESAIASRAYTSLWTQFIDHIDKGTLEEYVRQHLAFAKIQSGGV